MINKLRKNPGIKFLFEYSPKTYDRKEILRKIMNFVSSCKVEGDYLEFGVYKGATFIEAYKMAEAKKIFSMKFFAFDSFEGLSVPQGIDKNFGQFYKGQFSNSLDSFKRSLDANNIKKEKIVITKGWFKDVLNNNTKEKIDIKSAAVIWIDCDLYESAVEVFNFISDLVVDGTIIVLDDFFFYKGRSDMGERRAFNEWLSRNTHFVATEFNKYSWHGNSFIINKINKDNNER